MRHRHHHQWSAWNSELRPVTQTGIGGKLEFDKRLNVRRCTDCGLVQEAESWFPAENVPS